MIDQNCILSKVLRAKYCIHTPFESVNPKPSKFWVQKGILISGDICKRWKDVQLLDGRNNWICTNSNQPLIDIVKLYASNFQVQSYLYPHLNSWIKISPLDLLISTELQISLVEHFPYKEEMTKQSGKPITMWFLWLKMFIPSFSKRSPLPLFVEDDHPCS